MENITNINRIIINFFVLIFILLIIFVVLLLILYYFTPNNYLIIPYDKTKYFLICDYIIMIDKYSTIELPIQYEMYYKFLIDKSQLDLIISSKLKSQNICLNSEDSIELIKFKPNNQVFLHNKSQSQLQIQIKLFNRM